MIEYFSIVFAIIAIIAFLCVYFCDNVVVRIATIFLTVFGFCAIFFTLIDVSGQGRETHWQEKISILKESPAKMEVLWYVKHGDFVYMVLFNDINKTPEYFKVLDESDAIEKSLKQSFERKEKSDNQGKVFYSFGDVGEASEEGEGEVGNPANAFKDTRSPVEYDSNVITSPPIPKKTTPDVFR